MKTRECYRPGMRSETRYWKTRTWPAVMNVNNPTRKYGGSTQRIVPTALERWMTRRGTAREAENTPDLLRAAAGSLWSILVWEDILERKPGKRIDPSSQAVTSCLPIKLRLFPVYFHGTMLPPCPRYLKANPPLRSVIKGWHLNGIVDNDLIEQNFILRGIQKHGPV
jgi:hypothetical protein